MFAHESIKASLQAATCRSQHVQRLCIRMYLEADVHIGAVDGGAPPQRETPVGDLVETRPLRIGQLLVPTGSRWAVSS